MANPTHYSCPRCMLTIAQCFCPSCNQFLTDDVEIAESIMRPPEAPEGPLEWCTAFGHWGDVFACVGVMKALMKHTGQEKTNVLYVGPDMDIMAWLKEQPFTDRVAAVKSTKDGYSEFWGATTRPGTEPKDWLEFLAIPVFDPPTNDFPSPEQFTQTHINARWFETRLGMPAQLWHDGVLPMHAYLWMEQKLQQVMPLRMGKVYHLHPVSTWSELAGNHWSHWLGAIEWLLEKTPHTFIITGLEQIAYLPKHPRLINLIGELKSNMHVLALNDFCDGVICTPNSVAHWSVIKKQKSLVIGNKATGLLTSYYRRFIERGETATYVNVDATLTRFQEMACEFFEK